MSKQVGILNWENENNKKLKTEDLIGNQTANNKADIEDLKDSKQENQESKNSTVENSKQENQESKNSTVENKKIILSEFLKKYRDKLDCSMVPPEEFGTEKYLIFNKKKDDEVIIYNHYPCNQLSLYEFEPDEINVVQSGFIIKSKSCRTYVTKTATYQFYLDDRGLPFSRTTIKRNQNEDHKSKDNCNIPDCETMKLYIYRSATKIYKVCQDIEDQDKLIKCCLNELSKITDINYCLNIESQILLDSRKDRT